MKYQIYDIKTQLPVSKLYESRKRARTRADKLDLEYGAYRYTVRAIEIANNA